MRNSVYEIKEREVLLDDYYSLNNIEEISIFDEWLNDEGSLGEWARRQIRDIRWKKNQEKDEAKHWTRLSKSSI